MLRHDLDRYYTPERVAHAVVEAAESISARRCLDSACGEGSLLSAAVAAFPGIRCLGMDVDAGAIARLRRLQPSWTLSRTDALGSRAWAQASAGRLAVGAELALLNPPFSFGKHKGVNVDVGGFVGRCGVAMAHVLTVLLRARPDRCCAVLPESFLYSDLDAPARDFLRSFYAFQEVRSLSSSTFRGTRANAVVVRFTRCSSEKPFHSSMANRPLSIPSVQLVRGGLPMFEAVSSRAGLPHVHSTSLLSIATTGSTRALSRVKPLERGIVSGPVLLLPRVGRPREAALRAVRLLSPVQLSDCVIALVCTSDAVASRWERLLRGSWDALESLYKGTGARYTTVRVLQKWLLSLDAPRRKPRRRRNKQRLVKRGRGARARVPRQR